MEITRSHGRLDMDMVHYDFLRKKLKFDNSNPWYKQKPENEIHIIPKDLKMERSPQSRL